MKFENLKKNKDGLVPVVTQDYITNEVLMLAYMDEEAFNKTIETKVAHYFSRSRNELWKKGETSGHYQYVKNMFVDCDEDTLLLKVEQIGVACHTGEYSCFYREILGLNEEEKEIITSKVLDEVYNIVMDRKNNPKEGSYTNYLFDKGLDKILKKIGEEATEVVIGAKNEGIDEIAYEISDLLYHITVLLVSKGATWNDIYEELAERK